MFKFTAVESGDSIRPKFIMVEGDWDISEIRLEPEGGSGLTPNETCLTIPLDGVKRNTELIFKFDYYNKNGQKANVDSLIYGLEFSGSNYVFNEEDVFPEGVGDKGLKGLKGLKGIDGSTGPTGPTGTKGQKGITGDTGQKGATGGTGDTGD